jgi:sterol desaturase/sphingolipid hydroxylase (fatty acid hydroxylase superfamily)
LHFPKQSGVYIAIIASEYILQKIPISIPVIRILFNTLTLKVRLRINNKKKSFSAEPLMPKIVERVFLDFFSGVHWSLPLVVYGPLIGYWVYFAMNGFDWSWMTVAGIGAIGALCWTLVEYLIHRFVFHHQAKSKIGRRLIWIMHSVHHSNPNDPLRVVMPPSHSLPITACFYAVFYLIMGGVIAAAFMAGFTMGYVIYDLLHYLIHHGTRSGKFLGRIRKHHLRHHFKNPENGFGVSSMMWDNIFNTENSR